MSRQYDAKHEVLAAWPNDREEGVRLFLIILDVCEAELQYEEGMSSEEYIYGAPSTEDLSQNAIGDEGDLP